MELIYDNDLINVSGGNKSDDVVAGVAIGGTVGAGSGVLLGGAVGSYLGAEAFKRIVLACGKKANSAVGALLVNVGASIGGAICAVYFGIIGAAVGGTIVDAA